jgi:hypothetical protein
MLELPAHQAFQLCHRGACPEVLVLPEKKSRYCRVVHSETTWKKPGENEIEVLERKCSSFLKNPDIAM